MATPGLLVVISKPVRADSDSDSDAVQAFEYECKEAHRGRREFLLGSGCGVGSHEHYVRKDASTSIKETVDLYDLDDIDPIVEGTVLLEEGGDGPVRHAYSYAYRLMHSHGLTAKHSPTAPTEMVMLSLEPPLTALDKMNRWVEEDFWPQSEKISGYLSAYQASSVWKSSRAPDVPKYLILHRLDSSTNTSTSEELQSLESGEKATAVLKEIGDNKARSEWTFAARQEES